MDRESLSIDADAVQRAGRVLLDHEEALTALMLVPPATGGTTGLTAAALERVGAVVTLIARDLGGLADTLAALVADVERRDDAVTARFDGLWSAR